MTYSSFAELLAEFLLQGKNCIGQIAFSSDFSIRHFDDITTAPSELKLYQYPAAAREIARYDLQGNYRPLKTAPNLRRGWLLQLNNLNELALAIDFFYPAALSLYGSWLEKKLEVTPLRETLDRQTGMYRVTQQLRDEQADKLIHKQCYEGCMRKTLWKIDSPQEKISDFSVEQEIPLLCREACNLFVAAARKIVKENSR